MKNQKAHVLSHVEGFTLIELVIVISIIAVVSSIILFSASQYINKGKDSNISANLAILVPAGESYYGIGNTYGTSSLDNFCKSGPVTNSFSQMPINATGSCYSNISNLSGACCHVDTIAWDTWAACARQFTDPTKAFCVDSRGVKKVISNTNCHSAIDACL